MIRIVRYTELRYLQVATTVGMKRLSPWKEMLIMTYATVQIIV